jgi:TetR/AcrR family transcriptional repressor of nem operon
MQAMKGSREMPRQLPVQIAVLDAAQAMVQQRGYNAFSFHDLAREVGVKTASIHYYFPTKGDLGKALMHRYAEQVGQRLDEIDVMTRDARRKLSAFAGIFAEAMCGDQRNLCMGCMLATDLMTLPGELQEEVRIFFMQLETWAARVLREGRTSGSLEFAGSPEKLARTFIATLEGALIAGRTFCDMRRVNDAATWFIGSISHPSIASPKAQQTVASEQ